MHTRGTFKVNPHRTRVKVGVLLVLSSPSANWLKARASMGWSSDIIMEPHAGVEPATLLLRYKSKGKCELDCGWGEAMGKLWLDRGRVAQLQ